MAVLDFPSGSDGNVSICSAGSLGQEGPLEEGMVSHSSVLSWKILWTEEPGGESMELQRVGHN